MVYKLHFVVTQSNSLKVLPSNIECLKRRLNTLVVICGYFPKGTNFNGMLNIRLRCDESVSILMLKNIRNNSYEKYE